MTDNAGTGNISPVLVSDQWGSPASSREAERRPNDCTHRRLAGRPLREVFRWSARRVQYLLQTFWLNTVPRSWWTEPNAAEQQQSIIKYVCNLPVIYLQVLSLPCLLGNVGIILKLCLRCYVLFHPQLYLNCISTYVLISFSHGYSATLATKLIIKLDL